MLLLVYSGSWRTQWPGFARGCSLLPGQSAQLSLPSSHACGEHATHACPGFTLAPMYAPSDCSPKKPSLHSQFSAATRAFSSSISELAGHGSWKDEPDALV